MLTQNHGIHTRSGSTSPTPLDSATIAFQDRVIADGGEIIDINYVNTEVIRLKDAGLWDRIHLYNSIGFAVKKDVNDKVEKIYDLKRAIMDMVTTDPSYRATYLSTNPENDKPCIKLDGVDDFYWTASNDVAIIQPLTVYFNLINNKIASNYIYDGRDTFDNCALGCSQLGTLDIRAGGAGIITSYTNPMARTRAIYNGATSKFKVNSSDNTGDVGTNPMKGLVIGKPGGNFVTGSNLQADIYYFETLVLSGAVTTEEDNSTNSIYSTRYV